MSIIFMKFFSKVLGFGCGLLLPFSLQTYGSVLASSDIGSELASQSSQEALQKPIGIKNQGATCYANAVIQALLSFDFLREPLSRALFLHPGVKNRTPEQVRGGSLCAYLEDVMGKGQDGEKKFKPNVQQDAHEFMLAFFEGVRCSSDKNNKLLNDLFGLLRFDMCTVISRGENATCKKTSEFTFEVQANKSIFNAFDTLNNNEESISDGVGTRKYIESLRKGIIVRANVVGFDVSGKSGIKRQRNVEPEPYLIVERGNNIGDEFALNAIVLHKGESTNSGHYIALVRYGEDWYLANDSSVTRLGALPRSLEDFTPYLYFYQEGAYPESIQLGGSASLPGGTGGNNLSGGNNSPVGETSPKGRTAAEGQTSSNDVRVGPSTTGTPRSPGNGGTSRKNLTGKKNQQDSQGLGCPITRSEWVMNKMHFFKK